MKGAVCAFHNHPPQLLGASDYSTQQKCLLCIRPVLLDAVVFTLSLKVELLLELARKALPRGEARISSLHLLQSYLLHLVSGQRAG